MWLEVKILRICRIDKCWHFDLMGQLSVFWLPSNVSQPIQQYVSSVPYSNRSYVCRLFTRIFIEWVTVKKNGIRLKYILAKVYPISTSIFFLNMWIVKPRFPFSQYFTCETCPNPFSFRREAIFSSVTRDWYFIFFLYSLYSQYWGNDGDSTLWKWYVVSVL